MSDTLRTEMKMPSIGLGTYGLRNEQGVQAVASAIDIGYRHIDTAATYENEEAVGEGIRVSGILRESLWVTTKVDRAELSETAFVASAERSMEKLGLSYVDLLLIHWPNDEVPLEETLAAASRLIESGRVRNFGVSNFIRPRLEAILKKSLIKVMTNQVEYHPHLKQRKLLDLCRQNQVLLTAYSPLGQGSVLEDETLKEIADRNNRSVSQISLRWMLQQGITVIPKSSSVERMKENLGALEFELSDADMEAIHALPTRKRVIDWWPGSFGEDPDVF